ncbi:MAG: carbon starvation protein A [Lentisphaerae bacterium]|nr:carbon starvation protein A [Lentisphaerota bacterium]
MNGATLLGVTLVYFLLAYCIYGRRLKAIFGIESKRECPSKRLRDDIDYVPTPMMVLFGHHFASIAGAGPIVGPIVAAYLGWGPACLWILLGCVFIGSMHDFAAMFLSVRNDGRSIAYAIERELGYFGRQLFLSFCFAALILVVAIFALLVAQCFVATPAVATASVLFIAMAPLFGVAVGRKILSLAEASLIFVPILFACVWLGTLIPLDLVAALGTAQRATSAWIIMLLYYAAVASIIPVWVLLQPRDYLNSYLLYAMMILGIAGIFLYRPEMAMPAFAVSGKTIPKLFPLLFVTVACGACSGFHALVASGTSAKQLASERHVLPVAYGGMLVEGILAIIALISVGYLDMSAFEQLLSGADKVPPQVAFARGLATFSTKLGLRYDVGVNFVSLAISAFMLTTLDTATRLTRFVWQELLMPQSPAAPTAAPAAVSGESAPATGGFRGFLSSRWTATLIVVILAGYLGLSGGGLRIWPVFGASNQLLAALTLLAVTLWLIRGKRPVLFAMLPMFFMTIISIWALVCLIMDNWQKSWPLVAVSIILLVLALLLLGLAAQAVHKAHALRAAGARSGN